MENKNSSFLQSDIWGSFRESLGWHAHKSGGILILERNLFLGKTMLYSPEVLANPEYLLTLLPEIFAIAKRRSSIVFRLELLIPQADPLADRWKAALHYTQFVKAFESVQPEDRQIISLSGSEQEILAQMKPKGRYNIRLAEKAGVLVRETTINTLEEDVAIFYTLFQETAKRDKFSIRPKSYFTELCDTLYRHNCGRLFIATYQDQPVAASITTLWNNTASYLYGASSTQFRSIMAPYALHWSVIQWAMSRKATTYDLLAIRPDTKGKHKFDGITRFKQQFGGEAVHYLGSWDAPLSQSWYTLFKKAESLRRK